MLNAETQIKFREIIYKAGKLILSAGRDDSPGHSVDRLGVEAKEGSVNFVTRYDKAVQALLENELSAAFPGASFLAEEDEPQDARSGAAPDAEYVFVIDPIDGTTNFIRDYRVSVISAALLEKGEPLWGAVLQPYTGEYFHAVRGGGAYLGDRRIFAGNAPLEKSLIVFGTSPYYRRTLGRKSMAAAADLLMRSTDLRRSGSAAYDLCTLAAGRADGFFELSLAPWDYAAGGLILTEAGGIVTDADGKRLPLRRGVTSPVIAGNKFNHSEILGIVRQAAGNFSTAG